MIQIEKKKHLEIIKSIFSKYPYKFYAFGSRAKGTAGKYSDLDLCYQEEIPWNILSHIQEDFEESDLPFKIDLVNWKHMDSNFLKLIEKDLVLI